MQCFRPWTPLESAQYNKAKYSVMRVCRRSWASTFTIQVQYEDSRVLAHSSYDPGSHLIYSLPLVRRSIAAVSAVVFLLTAILKRSIKPPRSPPKARNHNRCRWLVVLHWWTLSRMRTLSNRMEIASLRKRPQLLKSSFMMNRPLHLLTFDKYHLHHPIWVDHPFLVLVRTKHNLISRRIFVARVIAFFTRERISRFWSENIATLAQRSHLPWLTQITDAQKTSVNASSPYITYVIRTGVGCSLFCLMRSYCAGSSPLDLTERRG